MRRLVIPKARGVVAEIGFGSGLNLPYYDHNKLDRLVAVEPDEVMIGIAGKKLSAAKFETELVQAMADKLPIDDSSVDTAVVTFALCTIETPRAALQEIRRILRPGGELLFIEHGQSDRPVCRRAQNVLNGTWGALAGGCNLNRDPQITVGDAGFELQECQVERFPLHLWWLGRHFSGVAVPERVDDGALYWP